MTVEELIVKLTEYDLDKVIVMSMDGEGWANIDRLVDGSAIVKIVADCSPIFSDN